MLSTLVFIVAAIIAALRVFGIKCACYQAASHLFVGGLIGAGIHKDFRLRAWLLATALVTIEIVIFCIGMYFANS